MELTKKQLGTILIIVSIVLFILLGSFKLIFDDQAVFMCELVSEDPTVSMTDCPAHDATHTWLLTIGFIIAGLLLFLGSYFIIPKNKKRFKNIKKSSLTNEEKTVYEFLIKKEGSAYQSDLVKETNWSKVKITRILDRLEQKEVLERKRRGMTNIVILK